MSLKEILKESVLRKLREEGLNNREVAKKLKVSLSTVYLYMHMYKIEASKDRGIKIEGLTKEAIEKLVHEGLTIAKVAEALNVSEVTIYKKIKIYGIKRLKPRELKGRKKYVSKKLSKIRERLPQEDFKTLKSKPLDRERERLKGKAIMDARVDMGRVRLKYTNLLLG